jgi:hypothetical protein
MPPAPFLSREIKAMTTSTTIAPGAQHWTVKADQSEYGWFDSYAAACTFARIVGGGTIHEYRKVRLTETKEITREEYEELVQTGDGVIRDPSDYALND